MVLVSFFQWSLKVIVFKITGHYKSWPFLFDVNSRINTKVKRSSSCLSNCKGLLGHAIKDTLAYQIAVCMRQDHCVKKSVYSHFILIGNWPQRCVGVNDFSASPIWVWGLGATCFLSSFLYASSTVGRIFQEKNSALHLLMEIFMWVKFRLLIWILLHSFHYYQEYS